LHRGVLYRLTPLLTHYTSARASSLALHQLRQLRVIRRDPSRLIFAEQRPDSSFEVLPNRKQSSKIINRCAEYADHKAAANEREQHGRFHALDDLLVNQYEFGPSISHWPQTADSWINPRSARRTASSRSRSIKRPPRNCSQATIRSIKTPRFIAGKPSAAFQMVRNCESDNANMWPWSGEGDRCQPLSREARGGKRRAAILLPEGG
jgi:hypothetical protein